MFTVYEKILPDDIFKGLYKKLCNEPGWAFENLSAYTEHRKETSVTFWIKYLENDDLFNNVLINKIRNLTGLNLQIDRVYANGNTYGLSGDLHLDDDRPNRYTFLYYVNPQWFVEWGGATIFTQLTNKIQNKLTPYYEHKGNTINSEINSFFPKPNTGLIYKSNVAHCALEPTRHCKELRITVSYKLYIE